jgi:hypothetical protein
MKLLELFAQTSPAPTLDFWRVIEHAVALSAILGVVLLWITYRRKREYRRIEPQPFQIEGDVKAEVKSRRFSAPFCDKVHEEVDRRLDSLEKEKELLWTSMRQEDKDIRAELSSSFQSIQRALGRIEGKLPPSAQS